MTINTGYDPSSKSDVSVISMLLKGRQTGVTFITQQLEKQLAKCENQKLFRQLKNKTKEHQLLQKKLAKLIKQPDTAIRYRYVKINNRDEALKHGKHSGWCTGKANDTHYNEFYANGKLWVLYKPKKRRPSYQLFISKAGVEFRKKGNVSVDPWEFAKENPLIKNWMMRVLPKRSNVGRFFDNEGAQFDSLRQLVEDAGRETNSLLPYQQTILQSIQREVDNLNTEFNHYSVERERRHRERLAAEQLLRAGSNWQDTLVFAMRKNLTESRDAGILYGINYRIDEPAWPTICIGGPLNGEIRTIESNTFYFPYEISMTRRTRHSTTYTRERIHLPGLPNLDVFRHSSVPEREFQNTVEAFFR